MRGGRDGWGALGLSMALGSGRGRRDDDEGWGWRGLAMISVLAVRAVHALLAVEARLVGVRFDSGLSPLRQAQGRLFDRRRAG